MKEKMNKFNEINNVLMNWNPLSVNGPALSDEYIGLIPSILGYKSESDLAVFLIEKFSTHYGIEYEDMDKNGQLEFQNVIKQLANILGIMKANE